MSVPGRQTRFDATMGEPTPSSAKALNYVASADSHCDLNFQPGTRIERFKRLVDLDMTP